METWISGTTQLLCLLGSPVGHSGSPAMYNFSFQKQKIDAAYVAFDVKEDQMPDALKAMRLFRMRGGNVTMPCKNVAATLMDELSPAAKIIGAVNVIVNENGRLIGHITDGIGFVRNLKEHGVNVKGKKLVVLGAGGAATAIEVQTALDGAKQVAIFNRQDAFYTRAETTAKKLAQAAPDVTVTVDHLEDDAKLKAAIAQADILVNATTVGMKPNAGTSLVDPAYLRSDLVVADTVYSPLKTKLNEDAEKCGAKTAPGKGMLLWQGAAGYKLWTGQDMPVVEYQAFEASH